MFTLLEKIASLLLNFTKSYTEHQDRARRREFGNSILTCYLRLLEVKSTGKMILDALENYLLYYRKNLVLFSKDNWEHEASYWQSLFLKQAINLRRLADAMHDIRLELCVLDPEVADLLPRTSTMKRQRFKELLGLTTMLECGKFPANTLSKDDKDEQIEVTSIWDEEVYMKISQYLVLDAPQHNLEELQKCANQIRELITQHLKIEEILWSTTHFDYDG